MGNAEKLALNEKTLLPYKVGKNEQRACSKLKTKDQARCGGAHL